MGSNQKVVLVAAKALLTFIAPPVGVGSRRLVATLALIMGLGRVGLFTYGSTTRMSAQFYGVLMLIMAAGLFFTTNDLRLRWQGRTVAAMGCGLMVGLGADVMPISATSALILFALGYTLLGEAACRES